MTVSAISVPVERQATNIAHGHGGILCRQPDALHPGKREKMPVGESLLSLPAFSRFNCAREIAIPFLQVSCGKTKAF
ncbi:MAG: hypothetical protein E7329_00025 [Clostridiales bacterium]|nr:hypothetical protein [Clostridiales bacterium]